MYFWWQQHEKIVYRASSDTRKRHPAKRIEASLSKEKVTLSLDKQNSTEKQTWWAESRLNPFQFATYLGASITFNLSYPRSGPAFCPFWSLLVTTHILQLKLAKEVSVAFNQRTPWNAWEECGRDRLEGAPAPIGNYSAEASLGNNSARGIYGTSVAKTIRVIEDYNSQFPIFSS